MYKIIALLLACVPTATLTTKPNRIWIMAEQIKEYKGSAHNSITLRDGDRFGHLTIIGEGETRGIGHFKNRFMLCRCDCGNETEANLSHLRTGHTKSCGCIVEESSRQAHTTHGKSYTPEYMVWQCMWSRCTNPKEVSYRLYGARGISVSAAWETFDQFFNDMGPRPSGKHSIERIDGNGNYCKENCRWATRSEQSLNTRKVPKNKTDPVTVKEIRQRRSEGQSFVQIAESTGVKPITVYNIAKGKVWKNVI